MRVQILQATVTHMQLSREPYAVAVAHFALGKGYLGASCSSDAETGKGSIRFTALRIDISSAMSSTLPVGILSLMSCRVCRQPVMATTHSCRRVSPTAVTAAFSARKTVCKMPLWSRMSRNSSPPRFLRLSTQPQTVTFSPTCSSRRVPHPWLLHDLQLSSS